MQPIADAELAQRLARLAGLELSLDRAADVATGIQPVLEGDVRIAALYLDILSPIGPTWPDASDV